MTAISRAAKGKQITITQRTDVVKDCEGDAQAWDICLSNGVELRIYNIYSSPRQDRQNRARPAQDLNLRALHDRPFVLAGDFNAHSPRWNGRCQTRANADWLETIIDAHSLVVHNDDSTTRHR